MNQKWEYVINGTIKINNQIDVAHLEMAQFSDFGEHITLSNENDVEVDLLLLGAEPYTEPKIS